MGRTETKIWHFDRNIAGHVILMKTVITDSIKINWALFLSRLICSYLADEPGLYLYKFYITSRLNAFVNITNDLVNFYSYKPVYYVA
jgi:hypothetical protein